MGLVFCRDRPRCHRADRNGSARKDQRKPESLADAPCSRRASCTKPVCRVCLHIADRRALTPAASGGGHTHVDVARRLVNDLFARVVRMPQTSTGTNVTRCGLFVDRGAAMGSYAWVVGQRTFAEQIPQLIYSSVKVPLLVAMTVAISLPSFFVINTLLGLRDDFREALRAIVSAQAGLAIILVSLFPLTLFSYVSLQPLDVSYQSAVLFNAAMLGLASISAQFLLTAITAIPSSETRDTGG